MNKIKLLLVVAFLGLAACSDSDSKKAEALVPVDKEDSVQKLIPSGEYDSGVAAEMAAVLEASGAASSVFIDGCILNGKCQDEDVEKISLATMGQNYKQMPYYQDYTQSTSRCSFQRSTNLDNLPESNNSSINGYFQVKTLNQDCDLVGTLDGKVSGSGNENGSNMSINLTSQVRVINSGWAAQLGLGAVNMNISGSSIWSDVKNRETSISNLRLSRTIKTPSGDFSLIGSSRSKDIEDYNEQTGEYAEIESFSVNAFVLKFKGQTIGAEMISNGKTTIFKINKKEVTALEFASVFGSLNNMDYAQQQSVAEVNQ